MFNKLPKIISAFLLVLSTTASAGYIDFTGTNEGIEDEFIFNHDGITLTISAWATNVDTNQNVISDWVRLSGTYGVYKGSSGLGVISSDNDGSHLDGGQSSDLSDLDEGLLFMFSEKIDFWGFAADYLSDNDDLNLSYVNILNSGEITTTDIFIDRQANSAGYAGFPISGVIGTAFMVWVDGNDDDVRIADTYITEVPEPGTLLIFSLALMGMVAQRRLK
jgi:hypothetical protein